MQSKSDKYLGNRGLPPKVSNNMYKSVSEYRKATLEGEVEHGLFRDGNASNSSKQDKYSPTDLGNVISSSRIKTAQSSSVSTTGSQWRGGNGEAVRQTPEVYSPLWLNSNMNLPRDRATISSWCRSFYALNPIVHNAINLHSTYPISKLNIRCPNKKVEKFFNEMIEEVDLMNICTQMAQEFFLLGEAFPYAELDEGSAKWSRIILQNPDYVVVKRTVIASEPIIMLRPDENLKKIVFSNKPSDMAQKAQLNENIIEHIKRGENIPLDNFYISHLARRISPYEVRGTGLPVSCFRQLMLFDKLRECFDEETEVLTDQGFKKYQEVIEFAETMNGTYSAPYISYAEPKQGIKIACFNPNNEQLEYHAPINATLYHYDGEMYHFANEKIDIKTTPNHNMWVSEKEYEYHGHRSKRKTKWGEWKKVQAQNINPNKCNRSRAKINWAGNDNIKFIDVCGKEVPIELYLEFLGYLISEGCLYTNNKSQYTVGICQTVKKYKDQMSDCITKLSTYLEKPFSHRIDKKSEKNKTYSDLWSGTFSGKDLYDYFKKEIGDETGNVKAPNKCAPRWIMDLSPRLLQIFLDALVAGDGSIFDNPKKTSNRFAYYTTSKQLADDVYEIVYKCGFVPTTFTKNDKRNDYERLPLHTIMWSSANKGGFPYINYDLLNKVNYSGKVWCFEVPTGLFITRRNGKITIQGNCKFAQADDMVNPITVVKIGSADYKPNPGDLETWRNVFEEATYDKDFKIFTHEGVTIERVGAGQAIYDTSTDITQLLKEIYSGLMVPSVVMDGGQDTTYANGGVALDILRQRYMQFRNMLSVWLKRKIFAPISKLNEFYEYTEKEKVLIIPEVEWNHMSLFDAGDYITNVMQMLDKKAVSKQTVYKSFGLEYEEEQRKMRKEAIAAAIVEKEAISLKAMPLNELRTLSDDDEIPEIMEPPVPGESPYDMTGGGGAPTGGPEGEPGGGGGPPALPPLPGLSEVPTTPGGSAT